MTQISEEMRIFDKHEWDILIEELKLSKRQSQIVQHLFSGSSDKQIAQKMNIALPTIRTHLSRLFIKLKVQDRHELILYVFKHYRDGCDRDNCPRCIARRKRNQSKQPQSNKAD